MSLICTIISFICLWAAIVPVYSLMAPKISSMRNSHLQHLCMTESGGRGEFSPIIVLISPRNESFDLFLEKVGEYLRKKVKFCDSIFDAVKGANDVLNVVDARAVDATLLKNSHRGIYVMHEGEDIITEARDACAHDWFVPFATASSSSSSQSPLSRDTAVVQLDNLLKRMRESVHVDSSLELDAGEWSHFVSLTFPSIDEALPLLPELSIGADAWELRVDLLADQSVQSIHRQIALLRAVVGLPVVYTVRSKGQIGSFPDDPKLIFPLLREGLRAGVEWLDVEACWPSEYTTALLTEMDARGYSDLSYVLGSLHVTVPQNETEARSLFESTALEGRADILKVVTGAADDDDNLAVHRAGAAVGKPYIGLCLGAAGALSRVLNRRFTPVSHPAMASAAPGQLSVAELMEAREARGLLSPKKFFLFGTPIRQSLSPAMHNSGFRQLLLPHTYGLNEQEDVELYADTLHDMAFGGASVTIPHKESIMAFLDEVEEAAVKVGAVNTIIAADGGRRVGTNTDWIGMHRPLLDRLSRRGDYSATMGGAALVVGAGGTARAACFAAQALGLDVYVTNRSPEKGRALAGQFGATFLDDPIDLVPYLSSEKPLQVVVCTLPAAAQWILPNELLQGEVKPVILDVVYKPALTPLMEQAGREGCLRVQGATMLLEQGIEQFEIWNKRRAPRRQMTQAIFDGVEELP